MQSNLLRCAANARLGNWDKALPFTIHMIRAHSASATSSPTLASVCALPSDEALQFAWTTLGNCWADMADLEHALTPHYGGYGGQGMSAPAVGLGDGLLHMMHSFYGVVDATEYSPRDLMNNLPRYRNPYAAMAPFPDTSATHHKGKHKHHHKRHSHRASARRGRRMYHRHESQPYIHVCCDPRKSALRAYSRAIMADPTAVTPRVNAAAVLRRHPCDRQGSTGETSDGGDAAAAAAVARVSYNNGLMQQRVSLSSTHKVHTTL